MTEIRDLLHSAAVGPGLDIDTTAVLRRGSMLRTQRRVARLVAPVLALSVLAAFLVSNRDEVNPVHVVTRPDLVRPGPDVEPAPDAGGSAPQTPTPRASGAARPVGVGAVASTSAGSGRVSSGRGATTAAGPSTAVTSSRGRIAFSSNRDGHWQIYTVAPDGSGLTRVTNGPDDDIEPAWSPDGTRLVFVRNTGGNMDVFSVNGDGSGLHRLTSDPGRDVDPAWSPDGTTIAFATDRTGKATEVVSYTGDTQTVRQTELYLMGADGSNQRRVMAPVPQELSQPAWSPDGKSLAYEWYDWDAVVGEIHVVGADGSGDRKVFGDGYFDEEPAWSPDGHRIAFRVDRNGSTQIHVVDTDGSNHRQLTNDTAYDYRPAWTPDGTRVAYSRDVDGERYGPSFETNPNSPIECSSVRPETTGGDLCPSGPAPAELWTINADGSGAARLYGELTGDAMDPDW